METSPRQRGVAFGAYRFEADSGRLWSGTRDQALLTLMRKGWGRDMPAFRQIFTSRFFRADADATLIAHFNELQRLSADPETAARSHESCHRRGDGRDLSGA